MRGEDSIESDVMMDAMSSPHTSQIHSIRASSGQNLFTRLANYFIRRFSRIAPLFYAVILVNLVIRQIAPMRSALGHSTGTDVILGMLFLNGASFRAINGVVAGGWSIAVETTFYICLPFLYKNFKGIRRTLVLFAVSAPLLHVLSKTLAQGTTDPQHVQYFIFLWFLSSFPSSFSACLPTTFGRNASRTGSCRQVIAGRYRQRCLLLPL